MSRILISKSMQGAEATVGGAFWGFLKGFEKFPGFDSGLIGSVYINVWATGNVSFNVECWDF